MAIDEVLSLIFWFEGIDRNQNNSITVIVYDNFKVILSSLRFKIQLCTLV